MRYAQLVMGPAGSGKSTYCSSLVQHAQAARRRTVHVVNLDPAAEYFDYQPLVDIRDLIKLDDAMEDEELRFGPNGGLIFCMEYLLENIDWLHRQLGGGIGDDDEDLDVGEEVDDDYIIFDCPGQIELYTHMKIMRRFVDQLQAWNFRICGVFLIDSHFMVDGAQFLSASTAALSVMVNLEIPHVNVLSKVDLLSNSSRKQLDRFLDPDTQLLIADTHEQASFSDKYKSLTEALARVLDDYSLVKFYPLNINDEESIGDLFLIIDTTIQYGEDLEVNTRDFDDLEREENEAGSGDFGFE